MIENFKVISLVNALETVMCVTYPNEKVTYKDEAAREETHTILKLINTIAGAEVIREEPYYHNRETAEGWESVAVDNAYLIVYGDRHNPIPRITENDLNIEWDIADAYKQKTKVILDINTSLFRIAKKQCKQIGVKFGIENGLFFVDSREKSVSVYKQIQKAYQEGLNSVSFDLAEINMPTVRTYASQFGSAVAKKIRCSVDSGVITVHFKENIEDELRAVVLKCCDQMSFNQIQDVISDVIKNYLDNSNIKRIQNITNIDINELATQPDHPKTQNFEEATNTTGSPEDATKKPKGKPKTKAAILPEGVEMVDDMPQYVIQELRRFGDEENSMPEDTDF